nr:hypothetical protein [Tanacetum cinerariifolium]
MDAMKSCLSVVDNELEETCWVRGSPRKVQWFPSLTNEIYGAEKPAVMVSRAPKHEIPKTTSAPSTGSIKNGIAHDIPKYAVADKDHNCGVGVSSGGTGLKCDWFGVVVGFVGGGRGGRGRLLMGGLDVGVLKYGLVEYGNLGLRMASSDWISGLRPEIKQLFRVCGDNPYEKKLSAWKIQSRGFVPSNNESVILGDLGLLWWYEDEEGVSLYFGKFMGGVLSLSVVRAVSWAVLRSAAELVAEMSCVRRSVSGGWASSLVVSLRGGMAAGELRMKASNYGTNYKDLREEELRDKLGAIFYIFLK